MSEQYIEVPIETDPEILAGEAYDYMSTVFPGWLPNDGNLETVLIEALAQMTAEARDVASAVPTDIFRYFGELVQITPQEATFAGSTTTWTMLDADGYTIPAGTQVGIEITGDTAIPFETTEDHVIPPGVTTAVNVPISAIDEGEEASGIAGAVLLLDTLDYVESIVLDNPTSGGQDAEDDDAYLNRLRTRLQLMAPTPILANDFAILATDIPEVARAVAIDNYNPHHNALTANQSSFETDTTGWEVAANCTIARVITQQLQGAAALSLTATSAATMSARNTAATSVACVPGETITGMASFKAAATGRTCRIYLRWLTAADALISATAGTNITDVTTGWIQATVTAQAPATAAKVAIIAEVVTPANAEIHYVDAVAIRRDQDKTWIIGGTAVVTNAERMVTVGVIDEDGLALSDAIVQEVDDYLESLREVNFIVHVIDPVYTTIDVQFSARAHSGYTLADLKTATEQALRDYLSPANWGIPTAVGEDVTFTPEWINQTTIRYLELTQVVNNIMGIDYVQTLQFKKPDTAYATTDLVLNGAIPLPLPGTITGTIT